MHLLSIPVSDIRRDYMAYKHRYCLDPLDLRRINRMWNDKIRDDTDWECFDDFALWCSNQGYSKGMYIRKHNELEPHGPVNSYFWAAGFQYHQQAEVPDEPNTCSYCYGCEKSCTNSMGCSDWQKWFVQKWNRNISISPKLRKGTHSRKTFQYEHPDLIREGIV